MSEIAEAILFALGVVLPIGAYIWASRDPRCTRAQLLGAAMLGGGMAGLIAAIAIGVSERSLQVGVEQWPWLLIATARGLAIGLLGLLARSFGGWLKRRP